MKKSLLRMWDRLHRYPFGKWLFSFSMRYVVPYSGSIWPRVEDLEPGKATVQLHDARSKRNHLNSIHAIALANLGELASGLAMITALPDNTKAIVTKIEIDYVKKARGTITAKGFASPPEEIATPIQSVATAELSDSTDDIVSTVKVIWQLAPQ